MGLCYPLSGSCRVESAVLVARLGPGHLANHTAYQAPHSGRHDKACWQRAERCGAAGKAGDKARY